MRTCVVIGDMSSDSASEQYPTIQICNDCMADYDSEDILNSVDFDPMYGNSCTVCHKTIEEEQQEQG
ncbi:MAG: hypothetical protein RMY28_017545 [Nostoc sp. ChiSLP01]|nr:hypothetical protein [Nostoc sp. CmiSLP01]MDZ8286860.1 hypothetical protein [Nostoc sp. ChiSLP01]